MSGPKKLSRLECVFLLLLPRELFISARAAAKTPPFLFDGFSMKFADGATYLSNEESPGCTNRM